ncbi:MAG: hypothetical protein ACYS80_26460, partial [Planctomycetota bacterium]
MKYIISIISVILIALTVNLAHAEEEPAPVKYAIKAGKILTMAPVEDSTGNTRVINQGIVLVSSGKIEALG